jgi:hypothetical protein
LRRRRRVNFARSTAVFGFIAKVYPKAPALSNKILKSARSQAAQYFMSVLLFSCPLPGLHTIFDLYAGVYFGADIGVDSA